MLRRHAFTLLATAVLAGAAVVASGPASGVDPGELSVTPTSGSNTVSPTIGTDAPCPGGSTSIYASVKGGNPGSQFPADGTLMLTPQPGSAFSTTAPFSIQTSYSFQDASADAGLTTLSGDYTITLYCQTDLSEVLATFVSDTVRFASASAYTVVAPVAGTTISLLVTPASPQVKGASLTFTATVTPSGAAGTVQFKDGAANVGTPQTVSGGTATLTTSAVSNGNRSFTAVFTPSNSAAYSPSTSAAVPFTITLPAPAWKPVLYGTIGIAYRALCLTAFDNATTVAHQWLVNGVVVSGATASNYVVPEAAYGKTLACKATASNADNPPVSATSSALKIGVGPALRATTAPYLYGPVRAGYRVYCKPGAWTPAATSYLYQWYLDGRALAGRTANNIVPGTTWRGHVLTCAVQARRTNWTTGKATARGVRIA